MSSRNIHIWDLPLRLFHWLLVLTIASAYLTAELGGNLFDWHGRVGALALGLIIFRLVWGFVGTTYARFANFAPTPARLKAYIKGNWQAHGHNPLGALSVFALLAAVGSLVGTGLFANDDIAFQGPLFSLISKATSDQITSWHALLFNGLLALITLHIAAIAYYALLKKTNLITPMLTGKKTLKTTDSSPDEQATELPTKLATSGHASRKYSISFVLGVGIAAAIVWLIFSGFISDWLSPASVAATPGW